MREAIHVVEKAKDTLKLRDKRSHRRRIALPLLFSPAYLCGIVIVVCAGLIGCYALNVRKECEARVYERVFEVLPISYNGSYEVVGIGKSAPLVLSMDSHWREYMGDGDVTASLTRVGRAGKDYAMRNCLPKGDELKWLLRECTNEIYEGFESDKKEEKRLETFCREMRIAGNVNVRYHRRLVVQLTVSAYDRSGLYLSNECYEEEYVYEHRYFLGVYSASSHAWVLRRAAWESEGIRRLGYSSKTRRRVKLNELTCGSMVGSRAVSYNVLHNE